MKQLVYKYNVILIHFSGLGHYIYIFINYLEDGISPPEFGLLTGQKY